MKKFLESTAFKYAVNLTMALLFALLAISGLMRDDEKEPGREEAGISEHHPGTMESFPAFEPGGEPFSEYGRKPGGEVLENTHTLSALFWLLLMGFHTFHHWKWFKSVYSKRLFLKNKLLTATTLVFVILALTGIAILIGEFDSGSFIVTELHDMAGKILIVLIIIHIIKHFKWFVLATRRFIR